MSQSKLQVLELSCSVQNYAWGKVGRNSMVAQLKSTDGQFTVDDELPYAELWMGVHPKAPSSISYPHELKGQLLSEWISDNQWALGGPVCEAFNGKLPFLFKVLSINKALSIQAHPDKPTASLLHSTSPDKYPDPNHKPEMVIALTPFKGFCGFRPLEEIKDFIFSSVPELKNLLSDHSVAYISNGVTNPEQAIKNCFTDLMNQGEEVVKVELSKLISRLQEGNLQTTALHPDEVDLLVQLNSWFPGDVGCFCLFFLNIINLQPGQTMFLGPNIPHAYVSGDIVECMANSDNVVRAGLSPKFRDKVTLCKMLAYTPKSPQEQLFHSKPHPNVPEITIFDPPTPEYAVACSEFKKTVHFPAVNGPSILIVIEGSGEIAMTREKVSYIKGKILFVPAMTSFKLIPTIQTKTFQAFCEINS